MANGNGKGLLKNILLIAGGGLAEILIESYADKYAPQQNIIPGTTPYNTGDALGALEATALTVVGAASKKQSLTMFGAGGLAVAIPNLIGKALTNNNVTLPGLRAQAVTNGYAGPVTPMRSGIAPAAAPQQRLVVGSAGGGGHVVYKPTAAVANGANCCVNNLFV